MPGKKICYIEQLCRSNETQKCNKNKMQVNVKKNTSVSDNYFKNECMLLRVALENTTTIFTNSKFYSLDNNDQVHLLEIYLQKCTVNQNAWKPRL